MRFFYTTLLHSFFYVTEQENREEQKLHYLNFPWICYLGTSLNLFYTSLGKNQKNNFSINPYLFIIKSIKFKKMPFWL